MDKESWLITWLYRGFKYIIIKKTFKKFKIIWGEVMGQQNSDSKVETSDPKDSSTFISILITTFSTIFLAELGDKTQLATLMLSAQSGKPSIVFIAAAVALITTSLLGVLIGRWIANNLPRQRFTVVSGFIMLSLGLYLVSQGFIDFIHN